MNNVRAYENKLNNMLKIRIEKIEKKRRTNNKTKKHNDTLNQNNNKKSNNANNNRLLKYEIEIIFLLYSNLNFRLDKS